MKAPAVVHDQKLFEGVTVILQNGLIGMKAPSLPIEHNDVLRHGVDQLSQFSLGSLSFFDVGSHYIPANDAPEIITERLAADQKPAILTIFSEEAYFHLPALSGCDPGLAHEAVCLQILRMKPLYRSLFSEKLLERQPVIVQHDLICMETYPVRGKHYDMLRNCVNQLSKFHFGPLTLRRCRRNWVVICGHRGLLNASDLF